MPGRMDNCGWSRFVAGIAVVAMASGLTLAAGSAAATAAAPKTATAVESSEKKATSAPAAAKIAPLIIAHRK